ncbi:hypothetical protein N7509_011332 [Penicillium cosmopolitanum]|uniref:Chitin-binding type-4 domain-containing protein n=1 Tax=Penicillium cosmopolitanum TaxID=1131564 RepID=A0A9X0B5H0_9EURO|nr:uncharacterized protein N7509_011332 [Penicillium cosmopolitanum]KAJ5388791.1 hypothetical protein N7509_011332 [Penicillium cosmopolitanum]
MKGLALLAGLLAGSASAHMQMSKPYPIRSPLNKDSNGKKDYSYTNPLQSSGSDYPCKGYAKDDFESQATYKQGQKYTMELEGSATHNGGSCQLALTYDQGETFKVIESILGDCPIAKEYDFTIPSDAPDGEALLAWTWFNKVGNREMYMNCAFVTVGGGSKGKQVPAQTSYKHNGQQANHPNHPNHPPMKQAEAPVAEEMPHEEKHKEMVHENAQRDVYGAMKTGGFSSLPELFVANIDQAGKCVTIEGEAVNFPMPGDNVEGKASGKGYKCEGKAPFLSSDSSSSDSSSSKDSDSKSTTSKDADSKTDSKSTTSKDADPKTDSKSTTSKDADSKTDSKKSNSTRSTTTTETTSQSMSKIASAFGNPSADPRVLSGQSSDMKEASTNNAFGSYVGGWKCTSGEILCAPDGQSWAMCSNSQPIYMGLVAAGTVCRFGSIVRA